MSATCSGSSKACLRALPFSQHDQVDDLVLAVEHDVVQSQQHRGRTPTGVRAQATWASRARVNASATS